MAISSLLVAGLAVAFQFVSTLAAPRNSEDDARVDASSTSYCCSVLQWRLGDRVVYPSASVYASSRKSYWSYQEADLSPACIVRPRDSRDVSTTVWILSTLTRYGFLFGSRRGCLFAVRGGGHAPFAGSANIDGGVTIDLSPLKDILVRPDRSITEVGPGASWLDAYLTLDAMNLAVSGGRISTVGVAGLTLGGGLSFFSPRYGLVCDNVENFEVVLASGKLVNANAREHSDLWFALRGGSNNFGVVTRFDLRTFEQGPFWGGIVVYPMDDREEHFVLFEKFNREAESDEYAALIINYSYDQDNGWIVANNYEYTKPEPYPAVFEAFTSIQPQLYSTMRVSNLSDFTVEIAENTDDLRRRLFATSTVGNSAALFKEILDMSNATLQSILPIAGITWALSYQAVPASIPKRSALTGGNALGLDLSAGPLAIILLNVFWQDAADDARIEAAAKDLFDQARQAAERVGLANDWIYLNYAAPWQDPIASYGAANQQRLQEISHHYDPHGVFQKNVPGGFKLFP